MEFQCPAVAICSIISGVYWKKSWILSSTSNCSSSRQCAWIETRKYWIIFQMILSFHSGLFWHQKQVNSEWKWGFFVFLPVRLHFQLKLFFKFPGTKQARLNQINPVCGSYHKNIRYFATHPVRLKIGLWFDRWCFQHQNQCMTWRNEWIFNFLSSKWEFGKIPVRFLGGIPSVATAKSIPNHPKLQKHRNYHFIYKFLLT